MDNTCEPHVPKCSDGVVGVSGKTLESGFRKDLTYGGEVFWQKRIWLCIVGVRFVGPEFDQCIEYFREQDFAVGGRFFHTAGQVLMRVHNLAH